MESNQDRSTDGNNPVSTALMLTDSAIVRIENRINQELEERFLRFLDVSEKTRSAYRFGISNFLSWMRDKNITSPQRADILEYKKDMGVRSYKPATIAVILISVKLFFRWLQSEEIYANVADHIKAPKQDKGHKKDYLTTEHIRAILDKIDRSAVKGKRDYAMLLLALTGGLRTIEISRADVADIRIIGNSEVLYIQGKGKAEKDDFIKITAKTAEAVREYLTLRNDDKTSDRPLFISSSNYRTGNRLTTWSISRIIKTRMKAAGFDSERLTAHSLRHTAITLSLMSGSTLQEVQQFARHSSINTTQIYAHNLDKLESDCEASIERAIFA
jgi:integrase/recombinase XerC